MADVEEAVEAARKAGLACLGGQVQFQIPGGICEAYWLNYDPAERLDNEPWETYVSRSAEETLGAFRRLCAETDFRREAREWEPLQAMAEAGLDPVNHLWFVLYFEAEAADRR
jgi:hypothetical protein